MSNDKKKGRDILNDPILNKGCAFTQEERDHLGLNGLLPFHIATAKEEITRAYEQFTEQGSKLAKAIFLRNLMDTNATLFYMLVDQHVKEMLPLIYTPVVGEVCQGFSHLYQGSRGLCLSYPLKDKMEAMIAAAPDDVQAIVVTDGERILGLGDLGYGGLGIPIGKLALYTIFGGIDPAKTLPIVLDVGTNNEELINDPLYLGWKAPRMRDRAYEDFIEQFVSLIKKRYPKVLLQWEDFAKLNASTLLKRYRDRICSFNDDIQGTACVTLSAIITAISASKRSLKDQVFVLLGGGSAGIGIASKIVYSLMKEGLDEKDALEKVFIVDRKGLLLNSQTHLEEFQKPFAKTITGWNLSSEPANIMLADVVRNSGASILIGVSGQGGAFTQEVIESMAKNVEHPIILPLSNPNTCCEAIPEDIVKWTRGKAIMATGSPYPNVSYQGKSYPVAQCNNVYIFPAVGLGVIASQTPKVTDLMFYMASKTLSEHSPMLKDLLLPLFPDFENLKSIARSIAIVVFQTAIKEGLVPDISLKEIEARIDALIWKAQL